MNRQYQLSNVTKNYLSAFHCILNEMIQNMTCAELKPILEAIITLQKRGIRQMEGLLKCMEC